MRDPGAGGHAHQDRRALTSSASARLPRGTGRSGGYRRSVEDERRKTAAQKIDVFFSRFQVPSFCRPSVSLDDMFKRAQQQPHLNDALSAAMAECDEKLLDASENL